VTAPPAALLARARVPAILVLGALVLTTWFGSVPPGLAPAVPALGLALVTLTGLRGLRAPRPHPETLLVSAVALAYRLPALRHPWGFVNKDGAYGAFAALRILEGHRPAPAFTEGAAYQGTLKAHLAALLARLTGSADLSLLLVGAGVLLSLVFVVSSMALARRIGGRTAAAATGLYLALGPKFVTTFSLSGVGQYVEILALGGLALALLARLLEEPSGGGDGLRLGLGVALGAAFWQQPVAVGYVLAAAAALLPRAETWRDPRMLLVPAGLFLGVLPALVWNAQHGWATFDLLGRGGADLRWQVEALPRSLWRTLTIAFPILAGLSPGHPWAGSAPVRGVATGLVPAVFLLHAWRERRALARALTGRGVATPVLPLFLFLASLLVFWATASGRIYWRPRYLLPVVAATAVALGAIVAGVARRSRPLAAGLLIPLLGLNVAGMAPRLGESAGTQHGYQAFLRSLEEKGIRTGYADFSLAAPVTMFSAERIVISSRLGPTPAYEPDAHTRKVEAEGPDAFLLRPQDDVEGFAALLRGLGVSFSFDGQPSPVFHRLSRRVRVEEVRGFFAPEPAAEDPAAPF
jgi:hypothetical protein